MTKRAPREDAAIRTTDHAEQIEDGSYHCFKRLDSDLTGVAVQFNYRFGSRVPETEQLGLCTRCSRAFAWKKGETKLSEIRCPACGEDLKQTSRERKQHFFVLEHGEAKKVADTFREERVERIAAEWLAKFESEDEPMTLVNFEFSDDSEDGEAIARFGELLDEREIGVEVEDGEMNGFPTKTITRVSVDAIVADDYEPMTKAEFENQPWPEVRWSGPSIERMVCHNAMVDGPKKADEEDSLGRRIAADWRPARDPFSTGARDLCNHPDAGAEFLRLISNALDCEPEETETRLGDLPSQSVGPIVAKAIVTANGICALYADVEHAQR